MTDNVVISVASGFIYVVISKEEKYVPYGELVGTTECIMLWTRYCTNVCRYNGAQL
jgi:hypothetical protein